MNEKQTKILDAYKLIYNRAFEISDAKTQDDFIDRIDKLRSAIIDIKGLYHRGVEQWEYHLGLNREEFDELMTVMRNWV
jgi:hypothetical protein